MSKKNLPSLTARIFIFLSIVLLATCAMDKGEAEEVDRWLVPPLIRDAVLNEFSGELALRHVEILSVDRDRQEEEYSDRFMETEYVGRLAKQYGLSEVKVDFFPSNEIWDAVEAELWMIEPIKKKMAGLEIVPEALASGSRDADVTAEVVYVGAGRNQDYKGKKVKGKQEKLYRNKVPRLARSEIPILINGERSVLDIYRIVRAEHAFVNTSSDEFKYAYVIIPDAPDVQLQSVTDYIIAMEKAGLVEIEGK